MFRRRDRLIVSQFEHSRLSGVLARNLGECLDVQHAELFGAIALHDWPHFAGDLTSDIIEIGKKTPEQQRLLVQRLADALPLDPFTELVVRAHWARLSDGDVQRAAADPSRMGWLLARCELTSVDVSRLDCWTDFCDELAFYLSRGDSAAGEFVLPDVVGNRNEWKLSWKAQPGTLQVEGLAHRLEFQISLLAYAAESYPETLVPSWLKISCSFESLP